MMNASTSCSEKPTGHHSLLKEILQVRLAQCLHVATKGRVDIDTECVLIQIQDGVVAEVLVSTEVESGSALAKELFDAVVF